LFTLLKPPKREELLPLWERMHAEHRCAGRKSSRIGPDLQKESDYAMRTETEILSRIEELRKKMELLEEKTREEMGKQFKQRDYRLLLFLDKERKAYDHSLSLIEWILS